jgi:predicted N-acyltransferase
LPGHDNARSQALLRSLEEKGFQTLGGDDLWYIPIDFASAEDFLDRLPARHRQRIRRNLKSKRQVEIRELAGDAPLSQELLDQLFRLSENVVEASDTRFVRFTRAWFDDFFAKADDQARLFLFYVEEQLAGFTLCLCVGKMLIFKTTGLDYSISKKYHIYFVAWFHMLEYCVRHHLSYFVAGQSNDSIKSYLGARATPTIHSVYFRNSLLRWATRKLKDRLGFGLPSGAPITHPEG